MRGVVVEHRVDQLAGRDLARDNVEKADEFALRGAQNHTCLLSHGWHPPKPRGPRIAHTSDLVNLLNESEH